LVSGASTGHWPVWYETSPKATDRARIDQGLAHLEARGARALVDDGPQVVVVAGRLEHALAGLEAALGADHGLDVQRVVDDLGVWAWK
jgi:hypothetical protein